MYSTATKTKTKTNINKFKNKQIPQSEWKRKHVSTCNSIWLCCFDDCFSFDFFFFTLIPFRFFVLCNFEICHFFFSFVFHKDIAKDESDYSDYTTNASDMAGFEYEVDELSDSEDIESNDTSCGSGVRTYVSPPVFLMLFWCWCH